MGIYSCVSNNITFMSCTIQICHVLNILLLKKLIEEKFFKTILIGFYTHNHDL